MTNIAHIIMQKKGGAGKTTVSTQLAEYLKTSPLVKGRDIQFYDTDPSNKSFYQFRSLNVTHVDILDENGDIDKSKFDVIFNKFLLGNHDILIDTGSSNFHQLFSFLKLSQIVDVAQGYGKNVVFHVPINFDGSYADTCESLASVASTFNTAGVVIWANANTIKMSQVTDIAKTPYFQENKNIMGVVTIHYMDSNLEGADFRKMLLNHQTYSDVLNNIGKDWQILNSIRLKQVRTEIFKQLDTLIPLIYGDDVGTEGTSPASDGKDDKAHTKNG